MRLMKRVKRALTRYSESALNLWARYWRNLALVLLAVGLAVTGYSFATRPEKNYILTIAVPFGPNLAAHERLLVTDVRTKSDGTVCFRIVSGEGQGCVKSAHYYLIEQPASE